MRYPEKMLTRLPKGTRKRVKGHQAEDEPLADTQRRVILAGLDALDEEVRFKSSQNPIGPVNPPDEE
jgi:hypothetical protein